MKLFAFYLPQFHAIPENDEWWGEGFTEWVNVKKAKALYDGHKQPKVPLDKNYYNLLDKETVKWQLSLQEKYHVDGLIYYHYYFKGKLLLEKPAENLLKWKDVRQPFFFCWANHAWQRSWEGKSEIIMPLEYGNETDWERHFQYLLPFFRDDRYEKKDNMPLFCLFKWDFPEKEEMFSYWNRRSKEEGFNGIYFVETYSGEVEYSAFLNKLSGSTRRVVFREPSIQTFSFIKSENTIIKKVTRKVLGALRNRGLYGKPPIYDGSVLMSNLIRSSFDVEERIPCIWFEWDNTPRHKQRGYVITPYSEELFLKYMDKIADKDYVFINAWNEWAEGMMLEPTEDNGDKYLKWIAEWVNEYDS